MQSSPKIFFILSIDFEFFGQYDLNHLDGFFQNKFTYKQYFVNNITGKVSKVAGRQNVKTNSSRIVIHFSIIIITSSNLLDLYIIYALKQFICVRYFVINRKKKCNATRTLNC